MKETGVKKRRWEGRERREREGDRSGEEGMAGEGEEGVIVYRSSYTSTYVHTYACWDNTK